MRGPKAVGAGPVSCKTPMSAMPPFEISRRTKFLILVAFMVVSIVALPSLPFMSPWGLDLHNVHAFQRCVAGKSPYLVDAAACGDVLN